MTEITCPVCDATAEDISVATFDGKTIKCPSCGEYGVSGTAFDAGLLKLLDRNQRLSTLQRAKWAAREGKRPIILSTNI